MKKTVPSAGMTHAGVFHADDVFATALLQTLNPDFQVQRVFSVPKEFTGIVYDIGNGEYDHHALPRETRANGVQYAAFGKLWRHFGPQLVGQELADRFDSEFIQELDDHDNTGAKSSLASAISLMNPMWGSDESADEAFSRALSIAQLILSKALDKLTEASRAKKALEAEGKSVYGGAVLKLPRYIPTKGALDNSKVKVVVYPGNRGGWNVSSIAAADGKSPAFVPPTWCGKSGAAAAAEFPGMTFCHAGGFLCNFDTEENAVAAAVSALSYEKDMRSMGQQV